MQYTGLGDRMMKLFDTMLDREREREAKKIPPHLDLTYPNSSSSCLPVE